MCWAFCPAHTSTSTGVRPLPSDLAGRGKAERSVRRLAHRVAGATPRGIRAGGEVRVRQLRGIGRAAVHCKGQGMDGTRQQHALTRLVTREWPSSSCSEGFTREMLLCSGWYRVERPKLIYLFFDLHLGIG